MANDGRASFWTRLPGRLTAIAAVTGLLVACRPSQEPRPGSSIAPRSQGASREAPAASGTCANGSLADVRGAVGEILRRQDVNPRLTLAELGADDLDFIEIVMVVEERCSLELLDSEIEAGQKMTVEQLARLVDRKVQAKVAR